MSKAVYGVRTCRWYKEGKFFHSWLNLGMDFVFFVFDNSAEQIVKPAKSSQTHGRMG